MTLRLSATISGLIVLLDQLSKQLLKDADYVLIPGALKLTGTRNTGAAFSLFSGSWALPLLSALISAALILYIFKARPRGLMGAGLAIALGGALGNLIDRLLLGYVIDFFEFTFVRFAIFNVADIAIVSGCLCIAISILFTKENPHA